jgi:hypothetical protein
MQGASMKKVDSGYVWVGKPDEKRHAAEKSDL